MNIRLTNIHNETVKLFAKKGGVEEQREIIPGHSIVVDDYETRTIKLFKKRNFIKVEPAQLFESDSASLLKEEAVVIHNPKKTIDETVDPNHDEVMDDFHTTESHEVVDLTPEAEEAPDKPSATFKLDLNPNDKLSFEIMESEVKQYVENGFVKGAWSEEEIAFLKKNYPTKGRKYCSNHLNRNETSTQKKINSLGLKKRKKRK